MKRGKAIARDERENEKEKFNDLIDSAIDLDQVIVVDAEILSNNLAAEDRLHPKLEIQKRLSRILNYAMKNSERVCEISDFVNDLFAS